MKLEDFSNIIESTLIDLADVYRYVVTINSDSTTTNTLPSSPIATSVPCRISFIKLENPGDTGDSIPITLVPKLFFATTSNIKEGDYVVVTRVLSNGQSAVYSGQLGLPSLFSTHIEVLMVHRGDA